MVQHDSFAFKNIQDQWFHWNATSFWAAVNLGSLAWTFLGNGGLFADLIALVSGAWYLYNLWSVYRLQKALRIYRESLPRTQGDLPKSTLG